MVKTTQPARQNRASFYSIWLYICLTIFWRVGSKKSHHVNRGSSTIILALPKLKEKSDINILVHNSFYIHHPLLHLDIGKNYMRNVTSRFVCYPSIHPSICLKHILNTFFSIKKRGTLFSSLLKKETLNFLINLKLAPQKVDK